jgi:hypothetical protein
LVRTTREVADVVFLESGCARAVKEMLKYDPHFDIQELHFEAEEVFKEFFCNYLEGNMEYLTKVCGGAGLAIVKGELTRRVTEGWKYKYTDILDCG